MLRQRGPPVSMTAEASVDVATATPPNANDAHATPAASCFFMISPLVELPLSPECEPVLAAQQDSCRQQPPARSTACHARRMGNEAISPLHIEVTSPEGTPRVTISSGDDFDGRRVAPAAGVIIRDRDGNERGGIGVLDVEEGSGTRVVTALDHPGADAVGMYVHEAGTAGVFINEAPRGQVRGGSGVGRFTAEVGIDGTPTLELRDDEERPRLRLTLTATGAGAIEFLDASGRVVQRIVPEDQG